MGTTLNEYFSSGVNIINGQVIKTENVTQYFNGNTNQYNTNNNNQQQQTVAFDNVIYNTTRKALLDN